MGWALDADRMPCARLAGTLALPQPDISGMGLGVLLSPISPA